MCGREEETETAYLIGVAPDNDSGTPVRVGACRRRITIHLDLTFFAILIEGKDEADVKLGDGDVQIEVRPRLMHGLLLLLGRGPGAQVRLTTDAVDRCLVGSEHLHELAHGPRLGIDAVDAIVVVVELRIGIGLARGPEGDRDIGLADHVEELGLSETAVVVES